VRLYLAGPMRGYPEENFPAFNDAAATLREMGHTVFNPAENSSPGTDIRVCLAVDMVWICASAEGVALLPGWRDSKGATAERALAIALGIPIFDVVPTEDA
jgi:nucleoside 2-deoxyribosyltransferase